MTQPTLMLTRPRASAQAFVATLDPLACAKVQVVIAPLMEIVATGNAPDITAFQAAIFTSANGVAFGPNGDGRDAYCVGAQTAKQAQLRGWQVQLVCDTAQQLIVKVTENPPAVPLVHFGGVHTRGDVAATLSIAGIPTIHCAIYDQILLPMSEHHRAVLEGPCILPVFSPRTAMQLVAEAGGVLKNAYLIALSDSVAAPLRGESCANLTVLPVPQAIYMFKEVEKLCLALSLP